MSENILDADANPPALPAKADTATRIDADDKPRDPRYFWLTAGQYLVLGLIGMSFVYILFYGFLGSDGQNLKLLAQPEVARGVITYLIAVATVAIATVLAMASIMGGGRDLDRRFALGKEVLTLLIGVLGTIIGFYYGSSTKEVVAAAQTVAFEVAPVKLSTETPQIGGTFTLDTTIIGGTAPYSYSIKFDPAVVTPVVTNETSADGKIRKEFTVDQKASADSQVGFVIDIKDAKNQTFTYNKDGKQKLTLKAP